MTWSTFHLIRRSYTLLLRFCVTRKSHVPAVALLRTAIGLQTDSLQTESLHPALCKAGS